MNRSAIKTKNGPCPQEIRAILPLIANGTLPDEEVEKIRGSIASSPECAKEFEEFANLSSAIREDMAQIPVPSEALFDHILEQVEIKETKAHATFEEGWASLRRRLSGWFSLPVMQTAIAFAILVIIIQSVVIVHQSKKIAVYHTLSGAASTIPSGIALNIIFNPRTSEGALRNFLEKYKGQIIGGPGTAGVYTISFPKPDDPETFVKDLKRQKELIQFAEIRN